MYISIEGVEQSGTSSCRALCSKTCGAANIFACARFMRICIMRIVPFSRRIRLIDARIRLSRRPQVPNQKVSSMCWTCEQVQSVCESSLILGTVPPGAEK